MGHQSPRIGEPTEVGDIGDNGHRDHRGTRAHRLQRVITIVREADRRMPTKRKSWIVASASKPRTG
jgi:hypothetical protein